MLAIGMGNATMRASIPSTSMRSGVPGASGGVFSGGAGVASVLALGARAFVLGGALGDVLGGFLTAGLVLGSAEPEGGGSGFSCAAGSDFRPTSSLCGAKGEG